MGSEVASSKIIDNVVRLFNPYTQKAAIDELKTRTPEGPELRALATLFVVNPELRPDIQQIYPSIG